MTAKEIAFVTLVCVWIYYVYWKNERVRERGLEERYKQRLRTQRRWGKSLLVMLMIAALYLSQQEITHLFAERNISKSCSILFSLPLDLANLQYGPGQSVITSSQDSTLLLAWSAASSAASEDSHYQFFADWVDNFEQNLTGQATDTDIHSPNNVWQDQILPVCRSS